MNTSEHISPAVEGVLLAGLDDWTGVWMVVGEVRHTLGITEEAEIRSTTLQIIRFLLSEGLMAIGDLRGPDEFVPWYTGTEESVARLEREWIELGAEPGVGDLGWLALAPAGETAAQRITETSEGNT